MGHPHGASWIIGRWRGARSLPTSASSRLPRDGWDAFRRRCGRRGAPAAVMLPVASLLAPLLAMAQPLAREYGLRARAPAEWRVAATPTLRIGQDPTSGSYEFSRIVGARRQSTGHLLVADEASAELREFGGNGSFLGYLLRRGRGPREIDHVHRSFGVGDTMVVAEGRVAVHVVVPGPGEPKRVVLPEFDGWMRGPPLGATGSTGVVLTLTTTTSAGGRTDMPLGDSVTVAHYHLGDSAVTRVASVPLPPRFGIPGSATASRPYGFSPRLSLAADAERICVASAVGFQVACHDATGKVLVQVVRAVPARPVTASARRAFRDAMLRERGPGSRLTAGSLGAYRRQVAAAARFADRLPEISQLLLGARSELWVRRYEMEDGLSSSEIRFHRVPSRWSVFDAKGEWIADCTMPPRFTPVQVSRDHVLGVAADEDDVESVVLFPLVRSPHSRQPR